jgi:hypothetical protein
VIAATTAASHCLQLHQYGRHSPPPAGDFAPLLTCPRTPAPDGGRRHLNLFLLLVLFKIHCPQVILIYQMAAHYTMYDFLHSKVYQYHFYVIIKQRKIKELLKYYRHYIVLGKDSRINLSIKLNNRAILLAL